MEASMPARVWSACLLGWLAVGCGQDSPFGLTLSFPGPEARQAVQQLRVVALDARGGSSCAPLLDGTARPGEPGYPIETELRFGLDAAALPELRLASPGPKLFFAEGLAGDQAVLVHACQPVEADGSSPRSLHLALDWAPGRCGQMADCPEDGLFCNGGVVCEALACAPTPPPCDDGLACTLDVCDEERSSCTNTPDDAACDDGVPCTLDACDPGTGECTHAPNAGGCPTFHIGPATDTCRRPDPGGGETLACDFTASDGLTAALAAAPAEGARFLLYDNLGGPATYRGPFDVPGNSWIGAAPGSEPTQVRVRSDAGPNGALRLRGDGIHVTRLFILVEADGHFAISAWPVNNNATGATGGHLIQGIRTFAADPELVGVNSVGFPLALGPDCVVRQCHFYGHFDLGLNAAAAPRLRFVHNTFVSYQPVDTQIDATGSEDVVFAHNLVLSLASLAPQLIQGDTRTRGLRVHGNLLEGFAEAVAGLDPLEPSNRVTDNLVAPAQLESPHRPLFLADADQRAPGELPGEGVSLDGVDLTGVSDFWPGAFQAQSEARLPRRMLLRVGQGDCGGQPCDLDARAVDHEIQLAAWSSWPGGRIEVYPAAGTYCGLAVLGWPVEIVGMGDQPEDVVLDNRGEDPLLNLLGTNDRHDALLIVLEKMAAGVWVDNLSLRVDTDGSADDYGVLCEDALEGEAFPAHRFTRLRVGSVGTAAGLAAGFLLGKGALVQDSLVHGRYTACARLGPRRASSVASRPSDAKLVHLSCRLTGSGTNAPKAFFEVAAADGALFADVVAESAASVPLFRAQRRSSGDTAQTALDPPTAFVARALTLRGVSGQLDGFSAADGSYNLQAIDTLNPAAALFLSADDSHLASGCSALDSGVDPALLDPRLSLGVSLDGVDRTTVPAVDRGCYEQTP
jgi:hypothetical protein